jgi:hypothetical protein
MSIKLNAQSGGSVALDAPTQTTGSADVTFKLPVADGSANQLLKTDGSGNLGFVAPSVGIAMADQWSITTDNNKTDSQTIDTGWERSDYFFAQIGSGMSESSGVFTFPSTGIYLLLAKHTMNTSAGYCGVKLMMSSNSGGSYTNVSHGQITNTNNGYHHISLHAMVDVQNASTYRFQIQAMNNGNVQYSGDSSALRNGVTFIRLGDT